MKNLIHSMVAILLTLVVTSASAEKIVKAERELAAFTEVSLRLAANVHLVQGKYQKFEVKANASSLEDIITEVKDRSIIIRQDTKSKWKKEDLGKIDIYITMPNIEALIVSGSGNIFAEKLIKSVIIDLTISGSGNIRLPKLEADKVKASISGSGDIVISGDKTADNFEAMISGSGDIKASQFPVMHSNVKIAGNGTVSTHTTDDLKVRIAGSGDVLYKGGPAIDSKVMGSGRVKEIR